eukprot:COSAG02_NODE_24_length_52386_cov_726.042898_31_plen_519_part_00
MSDDPSLAQLLKSVGGPGANARPRGQMRRGRIATEHVKPGSSRALQARETAMRERAKLQLVKRGDTYLTPKTRADAVTGRQKLLARRSRGLGHAGPPAKHDYHHQTRRRTGPSGDHRSMAPHEWFAWHAGQSDHALGMVGGKQPRSVSGTPQRRAVAASISEPFVSPVPAGAVGERQAVRRTVTGRRTTGSPWAGTRGSPTPVALVPDARVRKDGSGLSLSGGSVETRSQSAASSTSPERSAASGETCELPSERVTRLAGEPPNKFVAQALDNSSPHLDLGLESETGLISPMGVDLSKSQGSAHRRYRTNGHRSGSFTTAPTRQVVAGRPHANRTGVAEGRMEQHRLNAGVEPSSSAAEASQLDATPLRILEAGLDALTEESSAEHGPVRPSSSAFTIKPTDLDAELKSLSALELQTKWNKKMTELEILGCQSKQGWTAPRPGSGATRRPDRPPSAPLERRRQANAQKGKKGDLKSRGALRPPSREGSMPQRYESPREVVPEYRSPALLQPEVLLTDK